MPNIRISNDCSSLCGWDPAATYETIRSYIGIDSTYSQSDYTITQKDACVSSNYNTYEKKFNADDVAKMFVAVLGDRRPCDELEGCDQKVDGSLFCHSNCGKEVCTAFNCWKNAIEHGWIKYEEA